MTTESCKNGTTCATLSSWMLTIVCCFVVGFRLGLGSVYGLYLVSGWLVILVMYYFAALEPSHSGHLPLTRSVTRFLKMFPIQLKTVRDISFLLGSLVLVFPSFSNGLYVTSSRRYVTSLPTSRMIRVLLAVGRVISNLCYTWPPGTGWVTGSPGQYLSRVTGSRITLEWPGSNAATFRFHCRTALDGRHMIIIPVFQHSVSVPLSRCRCKST